MFKFFLSYPLEHMWRFFIDGNRQMSPLSFDEGPEGQRNYISRCLAGFYYACSVPFKPLSIVPKPPSAASAPPSAAHEHPSIAFVKEIHKYALTRVLGTNFTRIPQFIGEFYPNPVHFDLTFFKNLSQEGLKEINAHNALLTPAEIRYKVSGQSESGLKKLTTIMQTFNRTQGLDAHIENTLSIYRTSLASIPMTDTPEERSDKILTHIVIMIAELERTHPFADGNCRTFCMILLNYELLRTSKIFKVDLVPAILRDPNRFDGYSIGELKTELIKGMDRTRQIYIAKASQKESPIPMPKFDYQTGLPFDTKLSEENEFIALIQNLLGLTLIPESEFKKELTVKNIYDLHQFSAHHITYKKKTNQLISQILVKRSIS